MNNVVKVLNDLNLTYSTLIRGRSYLIKPKSLVYDITFVLIKGEGDNFELSWWYQDEFAKTIKFKKTINILNSYNSLYQYTIRKFNNQ